MNSNDPIAWYALSDVEKCLFLVRQFLGWQQHPTDDRLWIPRLRKNDDFRDAATRPARTLPYFMTSRDALATIERFILYGLFPYQPIKILTETGVGAEGALTVRVRILNGDKVIGAHHEVGNYAYHDALIVAAMRASGLVVATMTTEE